ncbi:MAG TPA: hypothetical protein VKF14_15245 [Candidatus Dormibacteraeota bacterium]|nr:hypothetical protein [Candidatus Dormibacteraeota bacterium]
MTARLGHVGGIVAARRLLEDVRGLELRCEHHHAEPRVDAAFVARCAAP